MMFSPLSCKPDVEMWLAKHMEPKLENVTSTLLKMQLYQRGMEIILKRHTFFWIYYQIDEGVAPQLPK